MNTYVRLGALALFLMTAAGCGGARPAAQAPDGWKLVWSDEFNKDGRPDPNVWGYEEGLVRNDEAQYYTDRPENARVENGELIIEARREAYREGKYTSASLNTLDKKHFRYGRFEVRAKLPGGRGMWPAIWMLGVNVREVDWPRSGEIDIMENVGFDQNRIHANIHTEAFNHVIKTNKGASIEVSAPHENYHIYAVEWDANRMDFFVDDQKYFTYEKPSDKFEEWPFDQDFYLLINSAVGGGWGGQKGIDDAIFPQRYHVDYVRVYERQP